MDSNFIFEQLKIYKLPPIKGQKYPLPIFEAKIIFGLLKRSGGLTLRQLKYLSKMNNQ